LLSTSVNIFAEVGLPWLQTTTLLDLYSRIFYQRASLPIGSYLC
ncbi:7683_t:CDS:1, partial [Dentiscutata heterogama]